MKKSPVPGRALLGALCLSVGLAGAVHGGEPHRFGAKEGEELARSAAAAWSGDARLVWVESDEEVTAAGQSERWGYLFFSESRNEGRVYSIKNAKIEVVTDPAFDFPAPPLDEAWMDSRRALSIADAEKGNDYRAKHAGELRSMLLVRGVLNLEEPDATTWAIVYDSPTTSGLWVVVDARSGKVVKTWRG
ncbi:MAG: hypothetical protein DHS20C21_04430 [Gemmatimonadota bacterium]|nr:MAG: hypothetical protein DHS20C21_04430 [Gemmatimonadota bacterium]